jgi:hypothetical protein
VRPPEADIYASFTTSSVRRRSDVILFLRTVAHIPRFDQLGSTLKKDRGLFDPLPPSISQSQNSSRTAQASSLDLRQKLRVSGTSRPPGRLLCFKGHENTVSLLRLRRGLARYNGILRQDSTDLDVRFAIMSPEELIAEVRPRRIIGFSTMTRNEMRLAGYLDSEAVIDVCAGVGEARQ